MTRGDVVVVAAAGDYGKPRPAVIVQTNVFPPAHPSVIVCPMTTDLVDEADFRVSIDPAPGNGLRFKSQVMVDKPVTVRKARIGQPIGRLSAADMARVNISLAFFIGLSD
jgi:mRNA interferase MazF